MLIVQQGEPKHSSLIKQTMQLLAYSTQIKLTKNTDAFALFRVQCKMLW